MKWLLPLVASAALTGCSGGGKSAPADQPANPIGQWQVATLNGQPLEAQSPPITLSIGRGWMQARSQCVWWRWRYRTTGATLTLTPIDQDIPICERSRTPTEDAFERTMNAVSS